MVLYSNNSNLERQAKKINQKLNQYNNSSLNSKLTSDKITKPIANIIKQARKSFVIKPTINESIPVIIPPNLNILSIIF